MPSVLTQLPTNEEFKKFIGKNYHIFIPKFDKFSIMPAAFHPSWNWPAFFFAPWWFLYRKMYLWAVLSFICLWIPYLNLLAWIGWAVAANDLYYKHMHKKIAELKAFHGPEYEQYLLTIGGVHGWVPLVAIIVTLTPIALAGACLSIFATALTG